MAFGKIIGKNDEGILKVRPDEDGRTVFLRRSKEAFDIGTRVFYTVAEHGDHVDFADIYMPETQYKNMKKSNNVKAIFYDTNTLDILIVGEWKSPDYVVLGTGLGAPNCGNILGLQYIQFTAAEKVDISCLFPGIDIHAKEYASAELGGSILRWPHMMNIFPDKIELEKKLREYI
ncbi:MAG: hypothetical protein NDI94_02300 [Candidatus Woesearchaeota archaeon]|nr:hypothetical protein [Candidatus Woesearchaeota archaeon]